MDEAAQLAAVASLTGVPVDDIDAWIVVAVRVDGRYRAASNTCCTGHAGALMAGAACDLMADQAAEHHTLMS